jgi:glutathione peroxidase
MSRLSTLLCGSLVGALAAGSAPASDVSFTVKTLEGQPVDLAKQYQGKVLLVVNVASQCGLTPQYAELQALYARHKDKGLCVLGFPCNQFRAQEPGTAAEIRQFCTAKYGVSFDLFEKIDVNGAKASALYKHLTAVNSPPKGPGAISWNFEKFVVGRNGQVVARFEPRTRPDDPALVRVIETELAK